MRHRSLAAPACWLLTLCTLVGLGCASGQIGSLPAVGDVNTAAEIVVIRPSSIVGAPVSFAVAVDGTEVLALRSGTHSRFQVDPGSHTIRVRCMSDVLGLSQTHALKLALDAGVTYYLAAAPGDAGTCAKLRRVESGEAERLLRETEPLDLVE